MIRIDDLAFRFGLMFAVLALLMQWSVVVQALFPQQLQISPVCERIVVALQLKTVNHSAFDTHHHVSASHHVSIHSDSSNPLSHSDHQNHACLFCSVYAHLIMPPILDVHAVLIRVHIRLLFLQRQFAALFIDLQRLFLLPQGRAPPVLA